MKGVYNLRPHKPRYTYTWDVDIVTQYIVGMGENTSLPLRSETGPCDGPSDGTGRGKPNVWGTLLPCWYHQDSEGGVATKRALLWCLLSSSFSTFSNPISCSGSESGCFGGGGPPLLWHVCQPQTVAPDHFQDRKVVQDTCPVPNTGTSRPAGGRVSRLAIGKRVILATWSRL